MYASCTHNGLGGGGGDLNTESALGEKGILKTWGRHKLTSIVGSVYVNVTWVGGWGGW